MPGKKIRVVVEGDMKSGKSTIAHVIQDALMSKGFMANIVDDDTRSWNAKETEERVSALADNRIPEITIATLRISVP